MVHGFGRGGFYPLSSFLSVLRLLRAINTDTELQLPWKKKTGYGRSQCLTKREIPGRKMSDRPGTLQTRAVVFSSRFYGFLWLEKWSFMSCEANPVHSRPSLWVISFVRPGAPLRVKIIATSTRIALAEHIKFDFVFLISSTSVRIKNKFKFQSIFPISRIFLGTFCHTDFT